MENAIESSHIGAALMGTCMITHVAASSSDDLVNHTASWMLWVHRNPQKFEGFLQAIKEVGDENINVFEDVERKVALIDTFLSAAEKV